MAVIIIRLCPGASLLPPNSRRVRSKELEGLYESYKSRVKVRVNSASRLVFSHKVCPPVFIQIRKIVAFN